MKAQWGRIRKQLQNASRVESSALIGVIVATLVATGLAVYRSPLRRARRS
ncbi:MAG: hypothetical protein H5T70_12275 [Chloroflexi bacterium]|nr:hypothetical protein [Chloroflexota bacterium]MBC7317191.1 hypothetical protein [Chloroflexota bacterium]